MNISKKRICYVVHRYPPYPGGSEYNVRDLAEETVRLGHEVCVFSNYDGIQNGVKVFSDSSTLLNTNFDLIVVHGGDVDKQDFVLERSDKIASKILYLLILPSESKTCMHGLNHSTFIGCSTQADWDFVKTHNMLHKSHHISYGININSSSGVAGFKQKYDIKTKRMFLSCGGFWPHKGMDELAEVFDKACSKMSDTTLVLTGYHDGQRPSSSEYIRTFLIEDKQDVLNALYEADLYIMNSFTEGFGLMLLEAMYNETSWAARNIAGATLLKDFGFVYNNANELYNYMVDFAPKSDLILKAKQKIINDHSVTIVVNNILNLL